MHGRQCALSVVGFRDWGEGGPVGLLDSDVVVGGTCILTDRSIEL